MCSYILLSILSAECQNGWKTHVNTSSSGATQQFGINTLSTCKLSCVNNDICVAVDFDDINIQCWVHTNAIHLSRQRQTSGVTQHEKCSSDSGKIIIV